MQDIRFAVRDLLHRPGFTLAAILALALAIGSGTAMFSVVNAVLLRPLSFDDPDNVLLIWESNPKAGFDIFTVAPGNFADWRAQASSFETMAAYQRSAFTLTDTGTAERIPGVLVSDDFFKLLRTRPLLGRTLQPMDAGKDAAHVTVLSAGVWQQRFGGDKNIVGRKINLNGESYDIVGVMPANFMYPAETGLWVPMHVDNTMSRGAHYLIALGRLKDGVSADQATAEMKTIASRLEQAFPNANQGWTVAPVRLQDEIVKNLRQTLLILLGAVGFVLLIACANVANLLLARGADRSKEIAVRTAVGASRKRIIRQLLTESLILSLVGGVLGMALAYAGLSVLLRLAPPALPRIQETTLDVSVLAFTLAVSIATGIVFGIFPALQLSKSGVNEALKETARGSSGGVQRHRLRNLLVVAEVSLTIIVVTGAGLMLQSLRRLQQVDPGFRSENVLTAQLNLPSSRYAEDGQMWAFMDQLLEKLRSAPGVSAAGTTSVLPLSGANFSISFSVIGRPPAPPQDEPSAQMRFISPGYFAALGIPVIRGRDITAQDTASAQQVVVINQTLARKFFPNEDPVGQQMRPGWGSSSVHPERTIIGIVRDIHSGSLSSEAEPQYFVPFAQLPYSGITIVIRSAVEASTLSSIVREDVRAIDPGLALYNIRTMDNVVTLSMAQPRFSTALFSSFAILALILAAIGVYGVMAYSVTQRTHEIGIRMALGAGRARVLGMVLGETLIMAGAGIVGGIAGSVVLTRLMNDMLFGVSALDPTTFAVVALALILVALVAGYLPAQRATQIDPMVALREE